MEPGTVAANKKGIVASIINRQSPKMPNPMKPKVNKRILMTFSFEKTFDCSAAGFAVAEDEVCSVLVVGALSLAQLWFWLFITSRMVPSMVCFIS